jgi:anti-sigma factor RsiW
MTEIVCAYGVEQLMDYLEGVVSQDVRSALEAHVAGCPLCVAFIESYRATPRIFRDATATVLSIDAQKSLRAFLRTHRDAPATDD